MQAFPIATSQKKKGNFWNFSKYVASFWRHQTTQHPCINSIKITDTVIRTNAKDSACEQIFYSKPTWCSKIQQNKGTDVIIC